MTIGTIWPAYSGATINIAEGAEMYELGGATVYNLVVPTCALTHELGQRGSRVVVLSHLRQANKVQQACKLANLKIYHVYGDNVTPRGKLGLDMVFREGGPKINIPLKQPSKQYKGHPVDTPTARLGAELKQNTEWRRNGCAREFVCSNDEDCSKWMRGTTGDTRNDEGHESESENK
ncbi:hypothetical protein B0H13DRAFT_1900478 [Mycena leptocephala]|nr:hypothetical protein B0H13DRAFT_1900478 [Mycena leptocephala]